MISNAYLLAFALAFMGCVLTTPLVTRIAGWVGAIDRIDQADQFRRIHKGATPRMGGLGLAFGILLALGLIALGWDWGDQWPGAEEFWSRQWAVLAAALIVLIVGVLDDTRGLSPRLKLLGQCSAVMILYLGGIGIDRFVLLGREFDFCHRLLSFQVMDVTVHPVSLLVTLVWFLGCMNVWNLIDGMDGLASGAGVLVSATLMLVAMFQANVGSALMAAALAGGLVGFLLYNWHPAVVFLGDTGSLMIGLLIGVIGIQDSLKGASALSILFPLMAMGVPISDTAMAIFRRWVRDLPLSSADRRHLHHLLIGLGLTPRQAAVLLYCFTGFLCGVVLMGVAWNSEFLALILGISGCLAFLLILYSRRDELASLRDDFRNRVGRGRHERAAACAAWEAIQRVELCDGAERLGVIVRETAIRLGCDGLELTCHRDGRLVFRHDLAPAEDAGLSGSVASFRLTTGRDLVLAANLHQPIDADVPTDIAFRFLQRLALAVAERVERLHEDAEAAAREADPRRPAGLAPWAVGGEI